MAGLDPTPDPAHYVDLDAVQLWEGNYNEGDVGAIFTSIQRFGFLGALRLWKENLCMAGNHSALALRQFREVLPATPPAGIIVHDDKWYVRKVDMSHLSYTEAVGYAIADNHIARQASVDDKLLAKYLHTLATDDATVLEATGYDEDDVRRLLAIANIPFDGDEAAEFFDATQLTGATTGAPVSAYLIYVSFPDRESFLRGLTLLEGKERGMAEHMRMAAVEGNEWLKRMEALPDET